MINLKKMLSLLVLVAGNSFNLQAMKPINPPQQNQILFDEGDSFEQDLNKSGIWEYSEITAMLNDLSVLGSDNKNDKEEPLFKISKNNSLVSDNYLCPKTLLPIFKSVTVNSYKPVIMMCAMWQNKELVTNYFNAEQVNTCVYKFLCTNKPKPSEYTEDRISILNNNNNNTKNPSDKSANLDIIMKILYESAEQDLKNQYAGTILVIKSSRGNHEEIIRNYCKKLAFQMILHNLKNLEKSDNSFYDKEKSFVTERICELLLFKTLNYVINSSAKNIDHAFKAKLKETYNYAFADIRSIFSTEFMPNSFSSYNQLLTDMKKSVSTNETKSFASLMNKFGKKLESKNVESVWQRALSSLHIMDAYGDDPNEYRNNYLQSQWSNRLSRDYRWITLIDN